MRYILIVPCQDRNGWIIANWHDSLKYIDQHWKYGNDWKVLDTVTNEVVRGG